MTKPLKLLIQELITQGTNDQYVRENFRRIQEHLKTSTGGTTVVNNTTNIASSDEDASKLVIVKKANTTISALKAVRLVSNTHVDLADKGTFSESLVLGLALNGGVIGSDIQVLTFGVLEDPFFSYALDDILFLDSTGSITNIAPATGHSVQVGKSLGIGAIFINIERPIILS